MPISQACTRLANAAVASGTIQVPSGGGSASGAEEAPPSDALLRAREAANLRNWRRAFEELGRVPANVIEHSAEDQELLGEAAIWSGHHEASVSARQKAYTLFAQSDNPARAALVAVRSPA